jgi:hypothetical protein
LVYGLRREKAQRRNGLFEPHVSSNLSIPAGQEEEELEVRIKAGSE